MLNVKFPEPLWYGVFSFDPSRVDVLEAHKSVSGQSVQGTGCSGSIGSGLGTA